MKHKRDCGGFTLVELLVVILTGSVITLAAVTILLLGLRVNHQSGQVVTRQNTTRILLSAMEDVITEGTITEIDAGPESWVVKGEGSELLFSYNSADRTISTGGAVILEDVIASHISWDDTGKLITISVETKDGSYTASTYCRVGTFVDVDNENDDGKVEEILKEENTNATEPEKAARTEFLKTLVSQYKMTGGGVNPGLILNESGYSTGEYYAQWYDHTWPADTAWCVCYVSWALDYVGLRYKPYGEENEATWFANTEYFKDYIIHGITDTSGWKSSDTTPEAGDLIFFDWTGDGVTQHIGVVLAVEGDYIYTIEGNSANKVAVRKYAQGDERIDGYGDFDWLLENHTLSAAN